MFAEMSYIIVNWMFLGFGLLVGRKKTFEEATLDLGHFLIILLQKELIEKIIYRWIDNENNPLLQAKVITQTVWKCPVSIHCTEKWRTF